MLCWKVVVIESLWLFALSGNKSGATQINVSKTHFLDRYDSPAGLTSAAADDTNDPGSENGRC
jgi:hypothetical protein